MISEAVSDDVTFGYPVLRGFDYVELFVGNVHQAAHYYHTIWGFQPVASKGDDIGLTDRKSIVLRQGGITLVLTGAVRASSPVAEHLRVHGEGVATIGMLVADAEAAYENALERGASPVSKVCVVRDHDGEFVRSEVQSFDGFTHAFIDRSSYEGVFAPGFQKLPSGELGMQIFDELDHIAVAVQPGTLDAWVDFYEGVFGFELAHKEDVATELSGMRSKVVQHRSGACKFPLVEPAPGVRKSQVQEFLDFNNGPGVQHLALHTPDIKSAVTNLRGSQVTFRPIPSSYYDELACRVGSLGEEGTALRALGILVDHDEWGRLLQIFARPCQDRPTLFLELIERRGARGFGGGNIRALFECIEREQALRGRT